MTERNAVLMFDSDEALRDWKTVDDVVMGGRSESRVRWIAGVAPDAAETTGCLRFEGTVSLENNGGFCSARLVEADRGVSESRRLVLVARGDGRRYKFTVRTKDTPDSASWRLPFETEPDEWSTHALPLHAFELWRRGTRLSTDARLNPAAITSFGVLISDKQAGAFTLDLAELRAE